MPSLSTVFIKYPATEGRVSPVELVNVQAMYTSRPAAKEPAPDARSTVGVAGDANPPGVTRAELLVGGAVPLAVVVTVAVAPREKLPTSA